MNDLLVPIGWDAMRGQPAFQLRIPSPPAEVLLSDTMMARLERIKMPVQMVTHVAVNEATQRSHDADEARWHRNRPAVKHCPYDDACRFV